MNKSFCFYRAHAEHVVRDGHDEYHVSAYEEYDYNTCFVAHNAEEALGFCNQINIIILMRDRNLMENHHAAA